MSKTSSSALIKGTIILTLATTICKILGFIYVVPFTALVGIQGNILFEYAYKPYILLLSIATAGIPMAVSKFVSKYNELGDYRTGQRLFRSGLLITTFTGLLSCAVLFFLAPTIADFLISDNDSTGNSVKDVVFVIRMVSFALIVVPPMAIVRGFFQGHQSMEPTSYSQVVEQLVRILFILVAGFIIIHMLKGSIATAVGFATFAACLGAIAGSVVLVYYWLKRKQEFNEQWKKSVSSSNVSLPSIYKELISYAIPFVIVGLAIPLFQSIDTFTINKAMMATGAKQVEAETVNSIISLAQKVILIPVSLATAFGLTLVPAMTKSYTAKKFDELKDQMTKTFQVIFFLTIPASIGLMVLGTPAFVTLFGLKDSAQGGFILSWSAPTAILFSLFTVTAAMLQGIDKQKYAVGSLLLGLVVKLISTYWFVTQFEGVGSIITTDIGMLVSIGINLYLLKKYVHFYFSSILRELFIILLFCAIMSICVWITTTILSSFFTPSYVFYILCLTLGAAIGGGIYFVLSIRQGIFFHVLGNRFSFLQRFKKKPQY